MKNNIALILFSFLSFGLKSQNDTTGLPGDDFSLQGALELFKNSNTPEEFEKSINSELSRVNNIDLNNDGSVDYIKVYSKKEGNAVVVFLQVPVSETENHDIAAIELQLMASEEVAVQIVGDEFLYGRELTYEPKDPNDKDADENTQENGPSMSNYSTAQIVVNVWGWPCVQHVYSPTFIVWNSSYIWNKRPLWWNPWRRMTADAWTPFRFKHHRLPIRHITIHRTYKAHNFYSTNRVRSTTVKTTYASHHDRYTVRRTKTSVTGPKGNTRSKTTTVGKGPNGKVKVKRTKVKRGK